MIWVCAGCTAGVEVSAEGVELGVPVTPEAAVAPDVLLTTPAAPLEPDVVLPTPVAPLEPDCVLMTPAAPLEPDVVLPTPVAPLEPDCVLPTPVAPVEPDFVLITPAAPVALDAEAPLIVVDPDTLDAVPLVEPEAAAPIGTVVEPEVLSIGPDLEAVALVAAEPKLVVI
jgi:hypothetical protein